MTIVIGNGGGGHQIHGGKTNPARNATSFGINIKLKSILNKTKE